MQSRAHSRVSTLLYTDFNHKYTLLSHLNSFARGVVTHTSSVIVTRALKKPDPNI